MSLREVCHRFVWTMVVAGLPWAPLVFYPHLDPWQGQTAWAQGGICVALAMWIGTGWGKPIPNGWLAAFVGCVTLLSLGWWVLVMSRTKLYPLPRLLGLMHPLFLVGFYLASTATWRASTVAWLCKSVAWVGTTMVAYGYLQWANLDPIFKNMDWGARDAVVGMIGNQTHFAVYLSLLLPFLLWRALHAGRVWWGWVVATLVLIGLLRSSTSYAVSGLMVVAMLWTRWPRVALGLTVAGVLGGLGLVWWKPFLLNFQGRLEAWEVFAQYAGTNPLWGLGAGFIHDQSQSIPKGSPIYQWRHVHNEYFQLYLEYGVMGLVCVSGMAWHLWNRLRDTRRTPLIWMLSWVLIGFGLSSLTSYPAHLWMQGSLALLAYCGLLVLTELPDGT